MANEYLEVEELKATLELTGQTFADQDVSLALTAASRGIDNVCGRRFYADADAMQIRYYRPGGYSFIRIDDLITLTALKTNSDGGATYPDTWTVNTDFVLEPTNAAADGRPYTSVNMHPNGGYWFTPHYPRTIQVTGKFGWPAVPEEIKAATTILASKILRRTREAPFGIITVGIEDGTAMRIARLDPDVSFLIDPYVRRKLLF